MNAIAKTVDQLHKVHHIFEEEHELFNQVLNSIFAAFMKYLDSVQDFPLIVAI